MKKKNLRMGDHIDTRQLARNPQMRPPMARAEVKVGIRERKVDQAAKIKEGEASLSESEASYECEERGSIEIGAMALIQDDV
jgi:hypothetical protein